MTTDTTPARFHIATLYELIGDRYRFGVYPEEVAAAASLTVISDQIVDHSRWLEALLRDVLAEPHPETGEPQLGVNTRHRIRVVLGQVGS